jgi:hypothetical protein
MTSAQDRRWTAKAHVAKEVNPGTTLTKLGQQSAFGGNRKLETVPATLRHRREHPLDAAIEAAARHVKAGHCLGK